MRFRNRIKELREVPASALLKNPRNWRKHPTSQRRALRAALEEIGMADALLARETPAGLELIDGHLRADVSGDTPVSVLVLDVDEVEAGKLLATLDPLAAMAETDRAALDALVAEVGMDSEAIKLTLLKGEGAEPESEGDGDDDDGDEPDAATKGKNSTPIKSIKWGKRIVPMTDEEFNALEARFIAYGKENGTNFGFVASLVGAVQT